MIGHIYILQAPHGGPIKIGFTSRSPEERRDEISKHWPCTLKIIDAWEGTREEEKALHKELSHSRIGTTEWFVLTDSVQLWLMQGGFRGWQKQEEAFLECDYMVQQIKQRKINAMIGHADLMVRQLSEHLAGIERNEG